MLKLAQNEIIQDLEHGLNHLQQSPSLGHIVSKVVISCLRIVCPGEDGAADTKDEVTRKDGVLRVPSRVDRDLASPGESPVNDVVMIEGAGVEHLTYHTNFPLQQLNLGIANL